MANKYCNLNGANKISDEYNKINNGFDAVQLDVESLDAKSDAIDSRVDAIITTPAEGVTAQEIIDARKGKPSLGAKIGEIDSHLADKVHYINIKNAPYNAVGDGATDDTAAIQAALNVGIARTIFIPEGDYAINNDTGLLPKSNTKIIFEAGARLIAINSNQVISSVIRLYEVENIEIVNPVIVGDIDTNTQTAEGAGHGMHIQSVKNLKISGGHISECFTDGLYMFGVENGVIENLTCADNGRMGITLTSGKNVYFNNCVCVNSHRVPPMAGMDIEPNFPTDILENITVNNLITKNNLSAGLSVGLQQLNGAAHNVSIYVNNHRDYSSKLGEVVVNMQNITPSITGTIRFEESELFESGYNAILVQDYDSINTPLVEFRNPKIYNWNSENYVSATWGTAIKILRQNAGSANKMGNINIINPYFKEDRALSQSKGLFRYDDVPLLGFEKILLYGGNISSYTVQAGVNSIDTLGSSIFDITDTDLDYWWNYSKVVNKNADTLIKVTPRLTIPATDFATTFINLGLNLRIIPTGCIILGMTTVAGKYIDTVVKGASITLKKVSATEFVVVNQFGTWTVEP